MLRTPDKLTKMTGDDMLHFSKRKELQVYRRKRGSVDWQKMATIREDLAERYVAARNDEDWVYETRGENDEKDRSGDDE